MRKKSPILKIALMGSFLLGGSYIFRAFTVSYNFYWTEIVFSLVSITGILISVIFSIKLFKHLDIQIRDSDTKNIIEIEKIKLIELGERHRLLLEERARAELLAEELKIVADENEKSRIAAELANKAKSEFLAIMSHEFRTPLNAIGGFAEILEMGIRGPVTEAQKIDIEKIKKNQKHLLTIVNDVLNFAKIESGNIHYEIVKLSVMPALADVEYLLSTQLDKKGINYYLEPHEEEIIISADRDKLRQILINLLTNAIKFTASGGTITIYASKDESFGYILVEDTGRGISPDNIEVIFDPFVQAERGLTRANDGIGLGLAISRDLARAMGGDITVNSEINVGSKFMLSLPLLIDEK